MPISAHLAAVRAKVGHDLLTLAAAAICIFDAQGRLLLAEDAETGLWTLPGGAIDPDELPADAAVRECYEETGLLVNIKRLIGVFGGPEFRIAYPNGDVTYYTTIAFEGHIVGGSHQPDGDEIASLRYFSELECDNLNLSRSSRVISRRAFAQVQSAYFGSVTWSPEQG
jgi:8-oxo-dGTP pyrophosphatase MutT (NUDIX family)